MQSTDLGPFHTELLDYLSKGLSPTSSDQLSLEEIIENYQHLFTSKGALPLEKLLSDSFSYQEFAALGLGRYYPRMYRGLPRLYHRNFPSQSHIKKNFTHLPSLKKQALSKALFSLYGKVNVTGRVVLFTYVMKDGLGDYVAAIEVLRLLRARLPHVDLQLVTLVEQKKVPTLFAPEGTIVIPYDQECFLEHITFEVLAILRKADLILQMPTFFPFTRELVEKLKTMEGESPVPKIEHIGEYGFLESSWFHPQTGAYSLGLHCLEKGILTRKPCQATWDDVQNINLKKWRTETHHFYLAFLSTPIGGAIYLHALLKSLMFDEKGIDLCVPDLGWFLQFVERQNQTGKPILQWEMGVRAIEVYFENSIHVIEIAPQGKTVRLLCPGPISQGDFRALLALSGDWVGVRGNQSFSEVISQGKPFFYDGRGHSRYFVKDLLALAERRLQECPSTLECIRGIGHSFLYNMPLQEEEWVDEVFFQPLEEWPSIALNIGLALQDPETVVGYQKFNRILTTEFSANPFICHLVQRALCHRKNPEIERFENEQVDLFVSNGQTFTHLINSVCKKIESV